MSKSMTPSEREAYAFGYDMGKMAEADAQLTSGDYELGRRVGAKAERAAIVAWLREAQGSIRWPDEDGIRITRWDGNEFADRIESAAHLRGDDE